MANTYYSKISTPLPTYPTTLPTQASASENNPLVLRASEYGDIAATLTVPWADALTIEGSHFFALNSAAPTTALAVTGETSLTETVPIMTLYNASIYKTYILDFIRLISVTPAAASTDVEVVFAIDNINRYTSGGTIFTPGLVGAAGFVNNSNMASFKYSDSHLAFGSITASAASGSRRFVEFLIVKSAIGIARDVYQFNFGQVITCTNSSWVNNNGSTAANYNFGCNPIVIGPGQTFLMYLYTAGAAGSPTYIPVISWIER